MSRKPGVSRRELLATGTVGFGTLITGCLDGDDGENSGRSTDDDIDSGTDEERDGEEMDGDSQDEPVDTGVETEAPGRYTREIAPDGREYFRYVPSSHDGSEQPLLVALHGCAQRDGRFQEESRLNHAAEANETVVVYPEQTLAANVVRCWNWFEAEHITRGTGELASIVGVVEDVSEAVAVDGNRVYATGYSAGAAMVPNLLVEYADVFAAGSMQAGLQYSAVENAGQANIFQRSAQGLDPEQQGNAAYETMTERVSMVPTLVLHGTADDTVHPQNGHDAVGQAVVTNDLAYNGERDGSIDTTADVEEVRSSSGYEYTYSEYHTPEEETAVTGIFIEGMGHGYSGGVEGRRDTSPEGPSMNEYTFEFFDGRTLENPLGE